jgi:hypothetical protein
VCGPERGRPEDIILSPSEDRSVAKREREKRTWCRIRSPQEYLSFSSRRSGGEKEKVFFILKKLSPLHSLRRQVPTGVPISPTRSYTPSSNPPYYLCPPYIPSPHHPHLKPTFLPRRRRNSKPADFGSFEIRPNFSLRPAA